jgi:hypothetical protein
MSTRAIGRYLYIPNHSLLVPEDRRKQLVNKSSRCDQSQGNLVGQAYPSEEFRSGPQNYPLTPFELYCQPLWRVQNDLWGKHGDCA